MTEAEEGRPLSRRERRLREMAEAGELSAEQPSAEEPPVLQAPPASEVEAELDEPEISPFNPDGTPRSRREMRELRERAFAERQATEPDYDLEKTQAFSLEDLEEAQAAAAAEEPDAPETAEVEIIEEPAAGGDDAPAYSFPDIAPLDEGGSVFDDPAVRLAGAQADEGGEDGENAGGGEFDDLISRAVAQEGAANPTNASALILPDMGHTGGISGPIGETGELFITGSIELPKSLGETGGHSALLDSVQGDPDEFALGEAPGPGDSGIIAPVSAARAVSARSTAASVVTSPEKEKRRLPIALIATGGGLLIVIAGLAIWAASTGFFA